MEFANNIQDYAENVKGSSADSSLPSKADEVPTENENVAMLRGNRVDGIFRTGR